MLFSVINGPDAGYATRQGFAAGHGSARRSILRWCVAAVSVAWFVLAAVVYAPGIIARAVPVTASSETGLSLARWRAGVYRVWLRRQQEKVTRRLPDGFRATPHGVVTVYAVGDDGKAARVVREMVREYLAKVSSDLGVVGPLGGEAGQIHVIISPTSQAMEVALGERYGRNALGAYWRGIIWVLSPSQWLDLTDPTWVGDFWRTGPVVHELTHFILDSATAGNVPAWLDEGLAQYEEYKHLGYEWVEPANSLDQPLYSLAEIMDGFSELPKESLAYRQAFLLVRYLVESKGEGSLRDLVGLLSRGVSAERALVAVYGADLASLEEHWMRWLGVIRASGLEG